MENCDKIYIGSRTSPLAMAQTQLVIDALESKNPAFSGRFEQVGILTSGDIYANESLANIGGKGLFSKEIHQQLLNGHIHFAVHSLKDLETQEEQGIQLACVIGGEEPHDVLITNMPHAPYIAELPSQAVVGTSSPRRAAQLLKIRPDLNIVPIRGNVETRLKKLYAEPFDAIVLAGAGLKRLGLWNQGDKYLKGKLPFQVDIIPFSQMLPAVGQGVLAVSCPTNNTETKNLLRTIHDSSLYTQVQSERALLRSIGGHCRTAIGCLSHIVDGVMHMEVCYAESDGKPLVCCGHKGPADEPERVGTELGKKILKIQKTGTNSYFLNRMYGVLYV